MNPFEVFELPLIQGMFGLNEWGGMVTILALVAVAFVYFLAPALGYATYNRGLLLGAMWVLIGKMALLIFRTGILFLMTMDEGSRSNPSGNPSLAKDVGMTMMLFSMLESGVFILGMALFTGGLASLRRESDMVRREPDLRRAPPPRFPNE
ncbi:MAG TPA: hypothetical protein VMS17_09715 [Gemmataceae bacterium]|nr:hypothetical protein [Gemmataceae bacterium]